MTTSGLPAAGVATPGVDVAAPLAAAPPSGTPNLLGPSFDGVAPGLLVVLPVGARVAMRADPVISNG